MAGDWIKWCKGLPQKKEVLGIAEALGVSPIHAAGMCMVFWEWLDGNIAEKDIDEDGNAHVTLGPLQHQFLDRLVGADGFATALAAVGWLNLRQGSLTVPNFTRHNGQTGKTRALTAERVSSYRKRQTQAASPECNAPSVTPCNAPSVTREEKRREENLLIPSPNGEGVGSTPTRPPPREDLRVAIQAIQEAWNRLPPPIPRISAWSDKRRKHLKARLADPTWLDRALQAIRRIPLCPFLLGQNDRGWTANIDWFLRPETLLKLEEGVYATAPAADRAAPEPLSVTVHRLMQQREAASKPR